MKNYIRILSVVFVMVLCIGLMAACGNTAENENKTTTAATEAGADEIVDVEAAEPFVAPADQVGKVISADGSLITWYPYEVEGETIDFKGLKLDKLEESEMGLLYLEREVTYYLLVDGKMEKTTADVIEKDCVIGVTTLEEGVQEVYILSVPVEEEEVIDDVELDTDDAT